jgi:60 kDa SS-A/Ro ribonucleoprotein
MTRSGHIFGPVGPIGPKGQVKISKAYEKADKLNKEGFPAFSRTLEEDTLSVLLTQTLSNTFYCSQRDLAKETLDVLKAMAEKDPDFLAKALVYARSKGLMKLTPVVGLSILGEKAGKRNDPFRLAFPNVVRIPDDLREFVTLMKLTKHRLDNKNRLAKRMVQNFLRHMTEFHAVKYGSDKSEGITLRDIVRLTHPTPKEIAHKGGKGRDYERLRNGAQAELFGWLVKGWTDVGKEPSPTNPMVWALETLKRLPMETAQDEKDVISLIQKYKLPWEVVVPSAKKMTKGIWQALMKEMPYMALLRNLNTMNRHGVFEDKTLVKEVAKKLSDPENVASSKQFPFRFWNAFRAYEGEQAIKDALTKALEASFQNLPEIKGKACIFNDISNSMQSKVSEKSQMTLCEIAALFAAATFKKCDDVILLPFDTEVHPDIAKVSRMDTIMSIVQKIGISAGGTDLAAPIEHLLRYKISVDVLIGFTDNEDWAGRGFLTAFEEYKRKINPKAKAFLVTLAPHRDYVAPKGYPDVYFIFGWSESILRYIPLMLEGGAGQVEDIRKIDLATYGKKKVEAAEVLAATED